MVEPISMAVASLVAGGFLAEAGSGAWRTVTRVSEFLRQKFAGDQAAVRTLEQIAETPSAEGAQSDLRLAIDRHLESDPKFREELLAALASEGYERDDVLNARITVSDRANVGKIVQIKSVQGDVSF